MNEAARISVLPERCLSEILSLTSPRDACRAAAISKVFKSVADSDAVWEPFLPPDYREVIAKAVFPLFIGSKRQLYLFLSDSHILLDRGYLSFQVERESGKKCYTLGAKELLISWQEDTRYWEWGNIPESRFAEVGLLKKVIWLYISGKISSVMLSPKSTYVAYLVFRTTRDSRELDVPTKTRVRFRGIEMETENVYLQRPGGARHVPLQENDGFPRRRKDGWLEIKLGEFECNEGDDGDAEMVFEQLTRGKWKCGLVVEGIELRPNFPGMSLFQSQQQPHKGSGTLSII